MFNPLPIFHAFGLTGGLLLGLIAVDEGLSSIRRRCTTGRFPS